MPEVCGNVTTVRSVSRPFRTLVVRTASFSSRAADGFRVPNNVKLGFVLVLLLSACGTTAAEVTVGAAPTTVVAVRSDDQNDLDAFGRLGQFLQAADDADPSALQAVTVPGVEMVAANEESDGPSTISRAVVATASPVALALAIRSDSGVCLWYAFVQDEERFGSGEPCTATSALHGSSPDVAAGSPWHLVLDQSASSHEAKTAQSALRNALVAAKTYYSDAGTFSGISPVKLHEVEPNLMFVDADTPAVAADTVSVAIVGDRFAAAALSENGVCYWITEGVGISGTQYGEGTPCTGTAALAATGNSWKAD
jgi:hypothetical protein